MVFWLSRIRRVVCRWVLMFRRNILPISSVTRVLRRSQYQYSQSWERHVSYIAGWNFINDWQQPLLALSGMGWKAYGRILSEADWGAPHHTRAVKFMPRDMRISPKSFHLNTLRLELSSLSASKYLGKSDPSAEVTFHVHLLSLLRTHEDWFSFLLHVFVAQCWTYRAEVFHLGVYFNLQFLKTHWITYFYSTQRNDLFCLLQIFYKRNAKSDSGR